MSPLATILAAVFSIAVIIQFVRAVRKGTLKDAAARRAWLILMLTCLVVALSVSQVETSIDRHFGYLPVAILLRSCLMIAVGQIFFGIVGEVYPLRKVQR
jgi:hypothetical protein